VISGRRLADVRGKIGLPGIRYLGLHGWEADGGGLLDEVTRLVFQGLRERVVASARELRGVWVEDKQHALTVHYGDAPETERKRAWASINAILAPHADRFRIQNGYHVWEVLPREIGDKGVAVRRELAPFAGDALPVYVGDDRVDEPAFAVLREGITVRVGRAALSRARYWLAGVAEVAAFLVRLRDELA